MRFVHTNCREAERYDCWGEPSSFGQDSAQLDFLEDQGREKWEHVLSAADRLRDKFGESTITLGTGMKGGFRERTHENPGRAAGKV